MALTTLEIFACAPKAPPRRPRVTSRKLQDAIQHARNLCYNYEDTPECRAAWEKVEELSSEFEIKNHSDKSSEQYRSESHGSF